MAEHPCPICHKPAEIDRAKNPYSPFCSRRCKTIDLGRWLNEGYRIPVEDEIPDEGEPSVPPRGEGKR